MTTILNVILCFFGFHQWHYHRTFTANERRRICRSSECKAYQRLVVKGEWLPDSDFYTYAGPEIWEDIR